MGTQTTVDRVRVVTWNLWWRFGGWEPRQHAIATTLAELDADIVCLQEVWGEENGDDQVATLGEALGMDGVRTDERFFRGVSFGNAILSRHGIERVADIGLPPDDGPGHRRALVARVTAPHAVVPVVCTHLEYRFDKSAIRQEQVARLMQIVADHRGDESDHPVVLAGDHNALPTSDEVRMITGESPPPVDGLVMTDAWAARGEGAGVTWDEQNPNVGPTAWPRRRLDYVFVSWPRPKPLGNPIAAQLGGLSAANGVVPSDHYAVVVDLHEGPPADA